MATTDLSDEQYEELDNILTCCTENQEGLSGWDIGFIADIKDRFEKYDKRIFLSERQWDALRKIYSKVDK